MPYNELALNGAQERILALLGEGHGPELVASSVGVSVSYISQLLSDQDFAGKVAEIRVAKLAKHSERDATFDDMETLLANKFHDLIPFMMDPMKIMKALKEINSLKRRGSSSQEALVNQQTVVQLSLPTVIVQNFQVNSNNQVIRAGTQDLVTIQSGAMAGLAAKMKDKGLQNALPPASYSG